MSPERRAYIEAHLAIAEDFPDGAWGGYIFHEKGIDPDELEELQEIKEKENNAQ